MFMLPIGDEPNDPKRIAWMNYTLIALNVLVFVWMKVSHPGAKAFEVALLEGAYVPAVGSVETILTSMFLHATWLHLGGNMLFLWIFGDNIEARLGAIGYLFAYLAVGIAATLIYGAFRGDSLRPLVGASGAISGVQGLYFIACPRHRVRVFFWVIVYVNVVRINARWIMGIWFALQDGLPLLIDFDGSGQVAHLAHIGGLVSGLALMLVLKPFAPGLRAAELAELPRTQRYRGGNVRSRAYERQRRRDPYESGIRKRSRLDLE